jgi:hypothetical protein
MIGLEESALELGKDKAYTTNGGKISEQYNVAIS